MLVNRHSPPLLSFIIPIFIPTIPGPYTVQSIWLQRCHLCVDLITSCLTVLLGHDEIIKSYTLFSSQVNTHIINRSMRYLQTEYAHKIRNKCLKSKDHKKNTTRRPIGCNDIPVQRWLFTSGVSFCSSLKPSRSAQPFTYCIPFDRDNGDYKRERISMLTKFLIFFFRKKKIYCRRNKATY